MGLFEHPNIDSAQKPMHSNLSLINSDQEVYLKLGMNAFIQMQAISINLSLARLHMRSQDLLQKKNKHDICLAWPICVG